MKFLPYSPFVSPPLPFRTKINNIAKYGFFEPEISFEDLSRVRKKGEGFSSGKKGGGDLKYVEGQKEKGIRGGKQRGAY